MQRPSPSLPAFLALVLLCAALPPTAQVSPLALAHQQKTLVLLGQADARGDSRGMQQALLHALIAQTLPPPEGAGLGNSGNSSGNRHGNRGLSLRHPH